MTMIFERSFLRTKKVYFCPYNYFTMTTLFTQLFAFLFYSSNQKVMSFIGVLNAFYVYIYILFRRNLTKLLVTISK